MQPSGIELSSKSDHCLFKRSETLCFSPALTTMWILFLSFSKSLSSELSLALPAV